MHTAPNDVTGLHCKNGIHSAFLIRFMFRIEYSMHTSVYDSKTYVKTDG